MSSNKKELTVNHRLVMRRGGLQARETPAQNGKILFLIPNYAIVKTLEEVDEIVTRWIDKDHIEEIWDREKDAYNYSYGFRSLNIHTKTETDILKREQRVGADGSDDDHLCLKNTCFTVHAYIYQPEIESHPIFKYYKWDEYKENPEDYSIEIYTISQKELRLTISNMSKWSILIHFSKKFHAMTK